MNQKQYKRVQAVISVIVAIMVSTAVSTNNFLIAVAGVIFGMVAARLLYKKAKMLADERIMTISEKASRYSYSISTPVVGIAAFLLTMWGRNHNDQMMFAGSILSYVVLLMISVYSVSFYLLNRKYGVPDAE